MPKHEETRGQESQKFAKATNQKSQRIEMKTRMNKLAIQSIDGHHAHKKQKVEICNIATTKDPKSKSKTQDRKNYHEHANNSQTRSKAETQA